MIAKECILGVLGERMIDALYVLDCRNGKAVSGSGLSHWMGGKNNSYRRKKLKWLKSQGYVEIHVHYLGNQKWLYYSLTEAGAVLLDERKHTALAGRSADFSQQ